MHRQRGRGFTVQVLVRILIHDCIWNQYCIKKHAARWCYHPVMQRRRLTREESRKQTQQRLLDAALTVIAKKGVAGASVEDIAALAGYTRGAFYSNFHGKNDLFIALLRRDHQQAQQGMTALLATGLPPGELEQRRKQFYSRMHRDNECFMNWTEARMLAARDAKFRTRLECAAAREARFHGRRHRAVLRTPRYPTAGPACGNGDGVHEPGPGRTAVPTLESAQMAPEAAESILTLFIKAVISGRQAACGPLMRAPAVSAPHLTSHWSHPVYHRDLSLPLIAIALLIAGCAASPVPRRHADGARTAAAPPGASATEQVIAAERAFARSMADRNFGAFAGMLSSEAIFFNGNTVMHGTTEIAAGWQPYFKGAKAPFAWQPDHVEVLPSGKLALSTGPVYIAGQVVGRFIRLAARGEWHLAHRVRQGRGGLRREPPGSAGLQPALTLRTPRARCAAGGRPAVPAAPRCAARCRRRRTPRFPPAR